MGWEVRENRSHPQDTNRKPAWIYKTYIQQQEQTFAKRSKKEGPHHITSLHQNEICVHTWLKYCNTGIGTGQTGR